MTGNESELIERLIVEAAKRGAVELQLERAVSAAEDAAKSFAGEQLAHRKLSEHADRLVERTREQEADLQKVLGAMSELIIAAKNFANHVEGFPRGQIARRDTLMEHLNEQIVTAEKACDSWVPF